MTLHLGYLYSLKPSRTSGGTGGIVCDHYHRYEEDLDLLVKFGAVAYRFSLAWSRITPLGRRNDPVNEEGVAFYDKLIDGLIDCPGSYALVDPLLLGPTPGTA